MSRFDPIDHLYLADETACASTLTRAAHLAPPQAAAVCETGRALVRGVRARRREQSSVQALMHEYDLSSDEGVLLMCLAEALLRIPDHDTAERLIGDKLGEADWRSHLGHAESVFVNASTWGLMLTGKLIKLDRDHTHSAGAAIGRLLAGSSEPVVRTALRRAMQLMGSQFVMGRNIRAALDRAAKSKARHSFDMLGEAALTAADADRYQHAYADAIQVIGKRLAGRGHVIAGPGISVKLSALHPRYEYTQRADAVSALVPRLLELAQLARDANIGLTVDAEEADRLQLALTVFEQVYMNPSLSGWTGFGLAVQAYQKRALAQVDLLIVLAREGGRRIPIRLVKGAYWDTEIKRAQEQGLSGYPVFTRKAATDCSYLACARRLLAARDVVYPQFATHNAHTAAAILQFADESGGFDVDDTRGFEFQRLHGMGEALYATLAEQQDAPQIRVYAPVGSHEDLLPYLVRRLLENGANTSFVNQILDDAVAPESIVTDPVAELAAAEPKPHPSIPLPTGLFADRQNSAGDCLPLAADRKRITDAIAASRRQSLIAGLEAPGGQTIEPDTILNPARRRDVVGQCYPASAGQVELAVNRACAATADWANTPAERRAAIVAAAGDAMEAERHALIAVLVREAGKTWSDAIAEVREAVDFCRYYSAQARSLMGQATVLPGYTGETNTLRLAPRGVIACISPWNFPLAIFVGQVAAAVVTGNTVLAKPAEQTPLIAARAVDILHAAGVPREVLQLLPGDGDTVGGALTRDTRIDGVVFTGSVPTARAINRTLAEREGPISPLIAETGGLNSMIVDSSALPEQVVQDVIASAFHSAGQRCSALRVLMLQEDIADRVLTMLAGAMNELIVGDPGQITTDVGPVIDTDALTMLRAHAARMDREAELIARAPLAGQPDGLFFAPRAYRVPDLKTVGGEVFGPILHVLTWKSGSLDAVIDQINASNFGLTLGVHSRLESTWQRVAARARVGNCYVNRNMVGAIVGVQPFGGEALSGTGPKAGGPHYLPRFCTERTLTVNTTAVGGNASLLTLQD